MHADADFWTKECSYAVLFFFKDESERIQARMTFKALGHSSYFISFAVFHLVSYWQLFTNLDASVYVLADWKHSQWVTPISSPVSGGLSHVIPWPALCLPALWAWLDMKCITQKAEHCAVTSTTLRQPHPLRRVIGEDLWQPPHHTRRLWQRSPLAQTPTQCGEGKKMQWHGVRKPDGKKKTSLDALLLPWPLATWVDRTNTGVQQVGATSMVVGSCCWCHLASIPSGLGCSICDGQETSFVLKQVGQAISTFPKSRSRKTMAYHCSKFNAYCLLSCWDTSTLIFFPLLTQCDLASRSRSLEWAWVYMPCISLLHHVKFECHSLNTVQDMVIRVQVKNLSSSRCSCDLEWRAWTKKRLYRLLVWLSSQQTWWALLEQFMK